jgi:hypothetical protein
MTDMLSGYPAILRTGVHQYVLGRQTGFGADLSTRALFALSEWREWERTPSIGERGIVGSRRTKLQLALVGPLKVTYDLILTQEMYERLVAKEYTVDTLTLPYGSTIYGENTFEVPEGEYMVQYVTMSNIMLARVYSGFGEDEGRKRCTVELIQVTA